MLIKMSEVNRIFVSFILLLFLAAFISVVRPVEAGSESAANGTRSKPIPAERGKYALLVGISKYDRGSNEKDKDWWDLHTDGDVEILAETLVRKFKFKPENITILADEEVSFSGKKIAPVKPTGALIKSTFQKVLTDRTKPGDVVYFHFSGHGQQVPDTNGDEIDGMDESLVPSDYVSQKDGSKNIKDDEISVLLEKLSAKKPSNVTITLDSCFSGTATRGDAIARGGEWKGKPIDKKFAGKTDDSAADFITRGGGSRGGDSEQKYVFISAASQRQTAKEMKDTDGRSYGVFSYSLAKVFDQAGENTTYRDLFSRLTDVVTTRQDNQNPQIEGSEIDNLILEEGALPPQKFVEVKIGLTGKPYLVAGKLQGMTKGSKFALYPAEAKAHKEGDEIANGVITTVDPLTSSIQLDRVVDKEQLKKIGRGFETAHSYEDVMKVWVQDGLGIEGLSPALAKMGLVGRSADPGTWDVRLYRPDASDKEYAGKLILER
ncbi:MAG: caspase family protein, partial [Acidobacteriota bacterium]|nr:caspase family protein [Acidobacteriota bacterium]